MKAKTVLLLVAMYLLFFRKKAAVTTAGSFLATGNIPYYDYGVDITELNNRLTAIENQLKTSDFA